MSTSVNVAEIDPHLAIDEYLLVPRSFSLNATLCDFFLSPLAQLRAVREGDLYCVIAKKDKSEKCE